MHRDPVALMRLDEASTFAPENNASTAVHTVSNRVRECNVIMWMTKKHFSLIDSTYLIMRCRAATYMDGIHTKREAKKFGT